MHTEIAQIISEKLDVGSSVSNEKLLTARQTESTEAYHLYLRGRYLCDKYTLVNLRKGIRCFEQAIQVDGDYAPAYSGLSNAYYKLSNTYLPPHEVMPKAKRAAEMAVKLNPQMAEGHLALGIVKTYYEHDWRAAEAEYKQAMKLNSGAAITHQRYGWFLIMSGQFDAGATELWLSHALDPLAPMNNQTLGAYFNIVRQHDRAAERFLKVLELEPDYFPAHISLGWTYIHLGKHKKAIAALRKGYRLGKDFLALGFMGYAHAIAGERRQAEEMLAKLIEASDSRYVSPYNMAIICSALGDKEQAFQWLEQLYEQKNEWLTWLNISLELNELRSDPRYADLLQRVGFTGHLKIAT